MGETRNTTEPAVDTEKPLATATIVTVDETYKTYGDSMAVDEVSISVEELKIGGADQVKPQPATNEVKRQLASPSGPEESERFLNALESKLPDLVAAARNRWASFEDLADAYSGKEGWDDKDNKDAYVQIYPLVRKAFANAHGELVDMYASKIDAYVAITRTPIPPKRQTAPETQATADTRSNRWPRRQEVEFHYLYDLGSTPVGAETFRRINQLSYDARRILDPKMLDDCLRELYSAATDLIGIVEEHSKNTDATLERAKITQVGLDLDELEVRYLKAKAQLLYFVGVTFGTATALLGILVFGLVAGLDFARVMAVMLGAVGALLSVVQKISDNTLTIKYDIGEFYLRLGGFTRPILGSFAAFLLLLAITADVIPLSKTGGGGTAYLWLAGFAIGWAERAIPDIFTRAGFKSGLPPATKASGISSS
jgi:hypothetical protein